MIASLVNDDAVLSSSGSIRTCAVVISDALRWRSSDKLSKVAVLVVFSLRNWSWTVSLVTWMTCL